MVGEERKKNYDKPGKPYRPDTACSLLPLPSETSGCVSWHKTENFHLLFNTYIPRDPYQSWAIGKREKKGIWEQVVRSSNTLIQKHDVQSFLACMACRGDDLKKTFCHCRQFEGRTVTHLIIGLGNASPLEEGITLDPVYGVPYLPGQAIKSVCSRRMFINIAEFCGLPRLLAIDIESLRKNKMETPWELLEKSLMMCDEKKIKKLWERIVECMDKLGHRNMGNNNLANPDEFCRFINKYSLYRDLFGDGEIGKVVFHAAYPLPNHLLHHQQNTSYFELGNINSHTQPYRQGKEYPADYHDPVPVTFLTLNKGIRFRFFLTALEESLLEEAKKWLVKGLLELGIGAKTRAGYGEIIS